jgi:hypothetical protein
MKNLSRKSIVMDVLSIQEIALDIDRIIIGSYRRHNVIIKRNTVHVIINRLIGEGKIVEPVRGYFRLKVLESPQAVTLDHKPNEQEKVLTE